MEFAGSVVEALHHELVRVRVLQDVGQEVLRLVDPAEDAAAAAEDLVGAFADDVIAREAREALESAVERGEPLVLGVLGLEQ